MRTTLLAFALGIAVTALVLFIYENTRYIEPRIPPWHPFEMHSDLTLDDLVAAGYRFSDMPCGMVHFSKTMGDTTIRYYVNIDCRSCVGKYEEQPLELDQVVQEELIPGEAIDSVAQEREAERAAQAWELEKAQNPYWPFERNEVRSCYQDLRTRGYTFSMETIDSLAIRSFVERNGGYMQLEQWNCSTGGQFIVLYPQTGCLTLCSILRYMDKDGHPLPWEFTIWNTVPLLDRARMDEEAKRRQEIARY
ncbi:MAG: hypothetical protein R2817_13005 [Flavobacteriales bacterium]